MDGLLLPGIVSSIRSLKDGSVSILVETQELSPLKAGELFSLRNKVIAMYLSEKETIPQKEIDQIDSLEVDMGGKSQSQRIRSVLFRVFEQQPEGYKDFNLFYRAKTEKIIDHLKSKLT